MVYGLLTKNNRSRTMILGDVLSANDIIENSKAGSKEEFIREVSQFIAKNHRGIDPKELENILIEREKLGSTGLEEEIAIPHGKLKSLSEYVICFARNLKGIDFLSLDRKLKKLFFVVIVPANNQTKQLKLLARISKIVKNKEFRKKLLEAKTAREIHQLIEERDSAFEENNFIA